MIKKVYNVDSFYNLFPKKNIHILDIGSGNYPLVKRKEFADKITTVDFSKDIKSDYSFDVTKKWPKSLKNFDVVYISHCLEHFYPQDRDKVLKKIYGCLKKNGLLFIRVPHVSSFQATGLEHHTFYASNAFHSLEFTKNNPNIPNFKIISVGLMNSSIDKFFKKRNIFQKLMDKILNISHRFSDNFISKYIGGIDEVQCLLKKTQS